MAENLQCVRVLPEVRVPGELDDSGPADLPEVRAINRRKTMSKEKMNAGQSSPEVPCSPSAEEFLAKENKEFLPLSTSDLFGKSFSIRRDVLDLTMAQWEIADSLDLTSITPRDWIRAIGARGGFLTALLTDEEREFVRIVYLPNAGIERPQKPQKGQLK